MALRDAYLEGLEDMGLTNEITEKMNLRFDYFEVLEDIQLHGDVLLLGAIIPKGEILIAPSSTSGANEYYNMVNKYVSDVVRHAMSHVRKHLRHDLLKSSLDQYFAFFNDNDGLYSDAKTFIHNFVGTKDINTEEFVHMNRMLNSLKLLFVKLAGHVPIKGESRLCQENPYINPSRVMEKIKDKKDHVEFASGAVRDSQKGKGRMDLVPLDVVQKLLSMSSKGVSPEIELFLIEGFKDTNDVDYLYGALISFSRHFEDVATMILKVALHFEDCLDKYDQDNWKKGIPVWSFISSGSRHYLKWFRGDCDEHHELAFVWNILCCIATVERGYCDEKSC